MRSSASGGTISSWWLSSIAARPYSPSLYSAYLSYPDNNNNNNVNNKNTKSSPNNVGSNSVNHTTSTTQQHKNDDDDGVPQQHLNGDLNDDVLASRCPICNDSIVLDSLANHVQSCAIINSSPPKSQQSGPAANMVSCSFCFRSFHQSSIAKHMANCKHRRR